MSRSQHNDPYLGSIVGQALWLAVGVAWVPIWLVGVGMAALGRKVVSVVRRSGR